MENIVQGQWFRGPSADLGEPIEQSLRFTGDGRLVCSSTSGPSGNFTLSFWWKRSRGVTNTHTFLMFTPNQAYQFTQGTEDKVASRVSSFDYLSDGKLRDHSAWYHLVFVNNSGTTTLYINGVQQSDTATTPSGSGDMTIGSNQASGQDDRLVGYLAEYNLLDGQTLTATDFGRYNDDGVWVPIALDFTAAQYGAKGFRLVFDSSADGGIGDDSAPTGTGHTAANDFTPTGFTTTAISSSNFENDIDYEDTPTKNHCTLNPLDVNVISEANVAEGSLTAGTSTAGNQVSLRSTHFQSSGKWYFEVENPAAAGTNILAGWATHTAVHRFTSSNTGVHIRTLDENSVTMVAADFDNNAIWFGKDGTWDNSATQAEIEAGNTANASVTSVGNYPQSPAFLDQAGSFSGTANFNFGQRSFVYTVPSGFKALNTDEITEPTIKNGKEHFDTVQYTGSTSSNPVVNSLEFQPDFVWIKRTNNSNSHHLVNSVMGANLALASDLTNGEFASGVVSLDSNGFTINSTGGNAVSANGDTYTAWCWKAGGTAVSNTNGTITSSVSANTQAGFSIVSYTGNLTAGATVGHGLNSAPECIFVKSRDSTSNWEVKHVGLSSNDHMLKLNLTDAEEDLNGWNNTAPTSTVFSLGAANGTNKSGDDFIAYCWHSVEGYSKFGSYTGNGVADGPFVYLGFKPAFLLVKRVNGGTGNWHLVDAERDTSNPTYQWLEANETAQEQNNATAHYIDFLSNGFKPRGNGAQINNSTGTTYVYMAFAEHPFGGQNQPPATAR